MIEKQLTKKANYDKMTVEEAADDLRVHRSTISRLMSEGTLPYHQIGSRKLIKRTDLEKFFENQRVEKKSKDFARQGGSHGYSHSC